MARPTVMPERPLGELAHDTEFVLLVQRHGRKEVSIDEVIECLQAHERDCNLELIAPGLNYASGIDTPGIIVKGDADFEHLSDIPEERWDDMERKLFVFLSRTWALLWSSDPDDCDLAVEDTYFVHATARAYSAMYARWANHVGWLDLHTWDYTSFLYSQGFTQEYYEWLGALHTIVREKTRRRRATGKR